MNEDETSEMEGMKDVEWTEDVDELIDYEMDETS